MLRALDLAEALDTGDLTPRGVVELIAEAVEANEARIRAFAHLDLDALRIEASAHDGRGALHGLPVAFKDIIDTARMPTSYGSPIYKGWRPKADAPIVTMTEAAGGLLLGKATTTEFAFLNPSETVNPHHPDHTPGGSSAGSAAGVAAGMMPLAFGTQTGGSVIRPASFCGVAAVKTSFRLLPMVGVKPAAWTLDTLGLFGARVVDIAFGLEAISGRPLRVDGRDFGTPTFGVTRLPFAGITNAEADAALDAAIRAVRKAGAKVVEIDLPEIFAEAHDLHSTIYNYEGAVALAWEIAHHRAKLSEILLAHFSPPTPDQTAAYDTARGVAKTARRAAKDLFRDIDALLTYSAPGIAPDRTTTGNSACNKLFTLLGTPCVTVPGYQSPKGLPVGVQIVAAFGDDHRALAAANYVESHL